MTAKELRIAHRASPFYPFQVNVADGRSLYVPHPDFLSVSPDGRTTIVYQEDGNFEILDTTLITGLEVKKAKRNGKKVG